MLQSSRLAADPSARRRGLRRPVMGAVLLLALLAALPPVSAAYIATTTSGASVAAAGTFPTYSTSVTDDSPWAYYRGEEARSSAATSAATDSSGNARAGTYNGTTNGPSTYWTFDENSGSTARDSSGAANTGTLGGSATWATGRVGSAVSLNGTSQHVSGTRAAVNTSGAFTVSAWVYLTDNTLGRVAASQSGSISSGFLLRYNRWFNKWEFMASQGNTYSTTFDSSSSAGGSAALNTWTHLVGVHNGAGSIQLYVNGVAQTAGAHTSTWNATGAMQVGRVWEWGAYQGASDGWAPWAGRIDDVRGFNRALTANEISSLANGLPVTDWQFSEGAGSTTVARGPNRDIGTLTNAWWTTGRDGTGVGFDGSSSYIAGSAAAVTAASSFSVSAWVYMTAKTPTATIVSQNGANVSAFRLRYDGGLDRFQFTTRSADSTSAALATASATSAPAVNTWYHLVGVYDSTGPSIRLYVNGTLHTTTAQTTPWNATGVVNLGRGLWDGAWEAYFPGTIDGVKFYQRALAAADVTNLYNRTDYTEPDMTAGITGALQGAEQGQQSTTATAFAGIGNAYGNTSQTNPSTFTIECWFRSTSGGLLVGFADTASGWSGSYDRQIYLDSGGRLTFGVNPGTIKTLRSPAAYNDGAWHHVAASLGAAGLKLYVDGDLIASDPSTTGAQNYTGYWRWGGGNLTFWPNRPSTAFLTGTLDEVAIYPAQLSDQQIAWHYYANH